MTMSSAVSPLASHSFVHGIPNAFRIWLNVPFIWNIAVNMMPTTT